MKSEEVFAMQLKSGFAKMKELPVILEGGILRKTEKAIYVYGRGTIHGKELGICMQCGRELTHPVSVHLGIGPICGGHYHINTTEFTMENLKRMQTKLHAKTFLSWIPRSQIVKAWAVDEVIDIPGDIIKKSQVIKKGKIANISDTIIVISFDFDKVLLGTIKKLNNRRYNAADKTWSCSPTNSNIKSLKNLGFKLLDNRKHINTMQVPETSSNLMKTGIAGIKRTPYEYQLQGIQFLEDKGGRGLIADEMGLGKTMQALGYLQLHPEQRPAIIVVPASLKLNWKQEIELTLSNPECEILSGMQPYKTTKSILIINYDILQGWKEALMNLNPSIIIADEVHKIKNAKANRTKAFKAIAKITPHFIALSGTPIVNRPVEFFNTLNLLDSNKYPSFWKYAQRYCGAKRNGFGWDFGGSSNIVELHEDLKSIMIRRLKKDVLKELPAKQYSHVPMQLSDEALYISAEKDFITYLANEKGLEAAERAGNAAALAEINTLKQLAADLKMEAALNWISNFLESGQKLIVFATHKKVIDAVMTQFNHVAVKIDGSVSQQARNSAVHAFQEDDSVKLFVGNIQAAGVGLTLTAASNVAFLELPWTSTEIDQAIDRAHRIGQKNTVNIHYLLASGTIELKIAQLIDKKRKIFDALVNNIPTKETSLLQDIMGIYRCQK